MFLSTHLTDETKRLIAGFADEDRKQIHDCCTSIIVLGQNRAPIKKADINRHMMRTSNNIKQAIFNQASYELNKTFGLRLYELEDKARLLLVNSTVDFSGYADHTEQTRQELTVLFLILMDIFASADGKLAREELEATLAPLDLSQETLKNHIDSLIKKLYIVQHKEVAFQQDNKLYVWGPRAMAEVDPDNFFKLFMDIVGQGTEADWPEQKKRIDKLKAIPNR